MQHALTHILELRPHPQPEGCGPPLRGLLLQPRRVRSPLPAARKQRRHHRSIGRVKTNAPVPSLSPPRSPRACRRGFTQPCSIPHVDGPDAVVADLGIMRRKPKGTEAPNTWKDAIAAAQWLIENRYTAPTRLGIYGGSAGGILVGRAITERPDLFAAAIPSVGVMDSVRMELEPNSVANIPEFGTTKQEDRFRALLRMSFDDGEIFPKTPKPQNPKTPYIRDCNNMKV